VVRFAALLVCALALGPAGAAAEGPSPSATALLPPEPGPPTPWLGLVAYDVQGGDLLDARAAATSSAEPPADRVRPLDLAQWLAARTDAADVAALADDTLRPVSIDVAVEGDLGRDEATLSVRSGSAAATSRTRAVRVIADYAAELACDNSGGKHPSAVGDPVPRRLVDGVSVLVAPSFVDGGRRVALEVVLQVSRLDDPVAVRPTGARFLGDLDFPAADGALLAFDGCVANGEALRARVDAPGGRVEVTLTPHWRADAPAPGRVRRLDAGLLLRPVVGFTIAPPQGWGLDPAPALQPVFVATGSVVGGATLAHALDAAVPGCARFLDGSGGLFVAGDPAAVARAAGVVEALTATVARTVLLEGAARAGDRSLLAWSLPALVDRPAFVRIGRDRACLVDADTEVG
jgi:hypothetical protein